MRIAVVLRKAQTGLSIADEHDAARIAAYCRALNARGGVTLTVIRPDQRRRGLARSRHDGYLFVGVDAFTRRFVDSLSDAQHLYIWAKAYHMAIDPGWRAVVSRAKRLFDSCYLSGVEEPWGSPATRYLPTAFHDPWPPTARERVTDLVNRRIQPEQFDVVFSGSGRWVRHDQYRQRLLNRLAQMGLRICVAAPRSAWERRHQQTGQPTILLDPSIRVLGNWATARFFHHARCVLDLPWLDTVFATHPPAHDPNHSVWGLGWNIFRMGAYGAQVLTYDCPANRQLGLDEDHCLFYRSDVRNVEALAEEIAGIARGFNEQDSAARRAKISALFHARHRYLDRWELIYQEILQRTPERDACLV